MFSIVPSEDILKSNAEDKESYISTERMFFYKFVKICY